MKTSPADFVKHPFDSVFQNNETETVARNVMVILSRTGNTFRALTWEEYVLERKKDGNFSSKEKTYFDKVLPYCVSPQTAALFSEAWK